MRRDLPIGVFDSGVGGLTVASAINALLPHERLMYFGDAARCPYGNRQPDEVIRYACEILDFLYQRGVKLLVVACNTATATALPVLEARYDVPVIGVIQPGARAAVRNADAIRIGVIGTSVTVASGAYEQAIHALRPEADVYSLACPDFVPMVERGCVSGPEVEQTVRGALTPLVAAGVDTLILGCTHYPLLQAPIRRVIGTNVRLISSAEETAREVRQILTTRQLMGSWSQPQHCFFTTGERARMQEALTRWTPWEVQAHHVETVDVQALTV
ncbi:MAG: glutamate racemase [Alicyclobacillus sp.]|nr:glutamate racemase [Alicyclobacillus sp.]